MLPVVDFNPIKPESESRKVKRNQTAVSREKKRKRIWLLIFVVASGHLIYSYTSLHFKRIAIEKEIQTVQKQIQQEIQEAERIRREIDWLNSDEYIEQAAREELGMVKEGETVLYFGSQK